ncbi:MAG: TetR/AcrR family transcriptional regulator [Methylocystis sp.]
MRKIDPIKHDEKRREILEAAARCFQRKGFKGSSVSEICAEAGISPGHLYHYFVGKEAIIVAMAQSHLDALAERFQKTLARGERILDAIVAEMNWLTPGEGVTNATLLFEVLAESTRSEAIARDLQSHSRRMCELVAKLLQQGQARGEIDPALDPETAAAVLISLMDGARALALRDREIDPHRTAAVYDLLIRRSVGWPRPAPIPAPLGEP